MAKAGRDYAIETESDRTKAIGLSKLKSLAAIDLQKAIRMEHADGRGMCTCVTCGAVVHWKEIHAGHFISGRSNAILFDERNIHPQCNRCNTYLGGNQECYAPWMVDRYGQAVVDELRQLRGTVKTIYRSEILAMREQYRARIAAQRERLA